MANKVVQLEHGALHDKPGSGVAWYRGMQGGVFEVYKFLKKRYPEAAQAILDEWGMNKRGNIVIKIGKE